MAMELAMVEAVELATDEATEAAADEAMEAAMEEEMATVVEAATLVATVVEESWSRASWRWRLNGSFNIRTTQGGSACADEAKYDGWFDSDIRSVGPIGM